MMRTTALRLLAALPITLAPVAASAQSVELTTLFRGPGMTLEAVADGPFAGLAQLTRRDGNPGRRWSITTDGDWLRLRNEADGNAMCLDVINGGERDHFVEMRPCADYSGQFWRMRGDGDNVRLTTQFLGDDYCLDIVNGGIADNTAHMVPCADYSGQLWQVRP